MGSRSAILSSTRARHEGVSLWAVLTQPTVAWLQHRVNRVLTVTDCGMAVAWGAECGREPKWHLFSAGTNKVECDSKNSIHQCLCPQKRVPVGSCLSGRHLRLVSRSPSLMVQAVFNLLPLCWVPGQVSLCVTPLSVGSLFPIVLWVSWTKSPLVFKARHFGGLSLQCWTQGLGCLMWAQIP